MTAKEKLLNNIDNAHETIQAFGNQNKEEHDETALELLKAIKERINSVKDSERYAEKHKDAQEKAVGF